MATPASNPYIGPRSFTRKERELFFGRDLEARELLSLVISERLVLFYAQSGAGKSSLVNTSLVPGLEENGRAVLPMGRVSGELPAGVAEVDNIFVFNLLVHLDQSGTDPARFARMRLSDFLSNLSSPDGQTYSFDPQEQAEAELIDEEESPICVLIIDQFEEIITTHPDRWLDRADFFRQLDQAMQEDPQLSVMLTLREDYVAALEPYTPLLADRMRARFYMERMNRDSALLAIRRPAEKHGKPFAKDAAETLVDNLSLLRSARSKEPRPGQYVEPVQLQVVCFQLWQNLFVGQEKDCQETEISKEHIKSAGNIDNALADFYEHALAEILQKCKVSEVVLRRWFDHKLITEAGTRGTVFQGHDSTAGMANEVAQLLEDQFLLRTESRSGASWYELVHDRFVDPILQANRQWWQEQSALLRDAQAWADGNKKDKSLLYLNEKLKKALAEVEAHRK